MARIVKESLDRLYDYGIYLETRTIVSTCVYSEGDSGSSGVEVHMAERVIKALHLFSQTPDKPVKIILNSYGGSWYDGMAIYDAIRACPCHITVEIMGQAMSMASVILQAACERIAHPNAVIMIHDGVDGMPEGSHAKNFEIWAEQSKKIRKKMYEIYATKSGKDAKYWERKCAFDHILDAKQALEEGLIDSIFEVPEK